MPKSLTVSEINSTESRIPKFELPYLHPILMQFFDKLCGLFMNHKPVLLFHFKRGSKRGPCPHSEICIFGRRILK